MNPPSNTTVTWLHLSDIHLNQGHSEDCAGVLDALFADIKAQIKSKDEKDAAGSDKWQLDFIVVTGDIAQSGRRNEYELAKKRFFDPLLRATRVPRARLFVVPGNHDVNWEQRHGAVEDGKTEPIISLDFLRKLRGRRASAVLLNVFKNEVMRQYFLLAMNDYKEFVQGYFSARAGRSMQRDPLYGYAKVMKIRKTSVAVMGLNSALASGMLKTEDEVVDRGNLLVAEHQVNRALDWRGVKKADVRIALMHHPFSWLREFDAEAISRVLRKHCHLILRGHMHEPSVIEETEWHQDTVCIIPAGAVLNLDHEWLRSGYNFVRLDLDSGMGTIRLRTYDERTGWIPDVGATGEKRNGVVNFRWREADLKAGGGSPAHGPKDARCVAVNYDMGDT